MGTRALVRIAFIVGLTAICVGADSFDLLLPWHPFSTYGFSADYSGRVAAVDSIASSAGLHVGDRVDIGKMRPGERLRFGGYLNAAPEGAIVRLPMSSGRTIIVRSHPYKRSMADNVTDIIAVLAIIAYIVLAALLVLLRPTPVTWAFYVFSYSFCFTPTLFPQIFPPSVFALALIYSVAGPASSVAFVSFALRFPDAHPRGLAASVERVLIFGVAPALAANQLVAEELYALNAYVGPGWFQIAIAIVSDGIFVAAIAILLVRYVLSDAASRNRLQWVVAAFAVAFLPALVIVTLESEMNIFPGPSAANLAQAWMLLAPIALAYTVLKHRLFDIRLVFSRALVYAVITSITVGLLALVDWAFAHWLAESRFALIAELCLAVLIGVLLTTVHRRIERFLNGVIFRAQTLALQALRRFSLETDLISDPRYLLLQTYEALRSRLESEYAAIYTADGSAYTLATPALEATPAILSPHDFAVLRLRRWQEPFECDEPAHPLRGSLLLPMTARAQLVGFIVCGPKTDHTHYLPEEVETLASLAHRAGSAYALLTLHPTSQDPATFAPSNV